MADEVTINLKHYFYVLSERNEEIATVTIYPRHGVLWMTDVWVHAEHRRRGLATRLVREALSHFGQQTIYLSVCGYVDRPLSDEALAAWYGRFGFQPGGAPGVMVRPGEGAV